ncbi:MAG: sensor histidine kinase [Pleurocapsa sp.]
MNEIDNLREELKQTQLAYQMAAQMSEFKAGFLARTSHELRSPLSSMIGLHQLILSDLCESPEEQKEFISQAYHSALKLMKLIDEIVAVSKTEYGSNRLNLESLRLSEIFADIARLTHLQAANRNLTLEIVTPNPALCVVADRSRLIQLIVNLIDSGISVMKEGAIKVRAFAGANLIKIEIDLNCSAETWQSEVDSQTQNILTPDTNSSPEEIRQLLQEISLSPQMKLLLSQTLLETMGGSLELLDLSASHGNDPLTRFILICKTPQ